jgi:hypothetical protein
MAGILTSCATGQALEAKRSDKAVEIQACSLLSQREIETELNIRVEAPERSDPGYVDDGSFSSVCIWRVVEEASASDEDVLSSRQFVILNAISWPRGKRMAKNFLDAFYAAAEKGEIAHTPVERKLGDDALWWGDGLAVRRGDISFGLSVSVRELKAKAPGKSEEALARIILQRIDQRQLLLR